MIARDIKSMTIDEIIAVFSELGLPKFRATQVFKWLHSGCDDFSEMTNLPKNLREELRNNFDIYSVVAEKKMVSKIDGTVKYLFKLYDGQYIESVFMSYHHGYSVCISTQVGCNMGCSFCASGIGGKIRDLTASEMLSQIMYISKDNGVRISNVVMMGMGEPLDNFENSVRFLKLVSSPEGLGIGMRHISLSTSGVVPKIIELSKYNLPITLSISLHAPFDDMRSKMMPINKKWSINELLQACKSYQAVTTRRISFEYALIRGINDSTECADKLAQLLKGILSHVNLIPANPVVENDFIRSDDDTVEKFKNILEMRGITATVRRTLGSDIDASCGQLRKKTLEERGNENENL